MACFELITQVFLAPRRVDNLQEQWPHIWVPSTFGVVNTSSITTCFLFFAIFLLYLFATALGIAKGTSSIVELWVVEGAPSVMMI